MAKWKHTHKRSSRHGRHRHNPLRWHRIILRVFLLLVCAGLVAGVWYGTRLKTLTITTVDVSGGTTIDLAVAEQKVQTMLNGSYLLLVPKRFSYMYPHESIVRAVRELPHVAEATVTRTSPTALSIVLEEYAPYALWCTGAVASSTGCLFVSGKGFAFAEAPPLTGSTFLRYITEGRTPEVGATLAPQKYLETTKEFSRALMLGHGMYVSAITETSDGDVRYRLRGGGDVLVAKDANLRMIFENLDAVLNSAEFAHIKPGNFVYIDLRFGNKVFVKE